MKKYEQQIVSIEEKKDKELTKWREERDKLVGGLETILKKKDDEISSLRKQQSHTESNRHLVSNHYTYTGIMLWERVRICYLC